MNKNCFIIFLSAILISQFVFIDKSFARSNKFIDYIYGAKDGADGIKGQEFPRNVSPALKLPGACPQHYPLGAPSIYNEKQIERSFWLCETSYAVQYDPASKTPIWVAEVLRADSLRNSHEPRTENFRENPNLPFPAQGKLKDYRSSGYDRGHMAPAADMNNEESMSASFFLTNMVPQVGPNMNRGIWADLEKKVREQALKRGIVYVMTGPIYSGGTPKELIGASKIAVPTHLYKIVIDPNEKWTMGVIMPNEEIITKKSKRTNDQKNAPSINKVIHCQGTSGQERPCLIEDFIVDVREIQNITGINFFPKVNLNEYRVVSKPKLP